MKRVLLVVSVMLGVVLACVTCKKPEVPVAQIKITESAKAFEVHNGQVSTIFKGTYAYVGIIKKITLKMGTAEDMSGATSHETQVDETTFAVTVDGMSAETKYYYRYTVDYGGEKDYETEVKNFVTPALSLPMVTTLAVAEITETTAVASGMVTDEGSEPVTECGVCWGTSHNPTIDDNHANGVLEGGSFTVNLTGLTEGTSYYARAYAISEVGISYGNEVGFVTEGGGAEPILPSVATFEVTNITQSTATAQGNVTDDGGSAVTERGVCWSKNHEPSINDYHLSNGSGTGSYNVELTNLSPNTTYYVRAYAKNSVGIAYGNEVSFATEGGLASVITAAVSNVTSTTATCGGTVLSEGAGSVTDRGICWSTDHNPTIDNYSANSGSGLGSFAVTMTDLTPNKTYYVRAYAKNAQGTAYGAEVSFTALEGLPSVETKEATDITSSSAKGHGKVTGIGGSEVTERGICWSTQNSPTVEGLHESDGGGLGDYSINMTSLSPGTTYYFRAYAKNAQGITYGEEKQFSTVAIAPTVTTDEVTNVMETIAEAGGNVTADGGASVTERGVCWSTSSTPTISDSHLSNGTGMGAFTVQMSGLTPNTTYYVRAYAKNSVGVSYGNEVNFKTSLNGSAPSVQTYPVQDITQTTALSGGRVSNDGGAEVTERGICWTTSGTPTISDTHLSNGTGTGGYTIQMTNLQPNTTYYVRAYATNSIGTNYGSIKEFTTLPAIELPTVITNAVSNITQTTAIGGGNVTNNGGGTITERGICWSTSHNPTTSGSHLSSGSGTGLFSATMTGLTANTKYYVRAYAINSAGTAYGSEVDFTTLQNVTLPTVTTNNVSNVMENQATCGGNVTNNGGGTVTARGVCWSTSSNPTINNSHTTNGSGTGSFTSVITGLNPGTTYHVRAYATNSAGTGYGETRTFTTIASKYAYASRYNPTSGYIKYPYNNPNNVTILNSDLHLLGGDYYNGYLYAYGYTDENDKYYFYKINATSGSIVSSHYVGEGVYCSDCAYDYTTNSLYGSNGNSLYIINLSTGAQTYVGSFGIDGSMVALFCSASGLLYGIEARGTTAHGSFYSINKTTGSATLIATYGYYVNYAQSGGFDQDTGTLYWAGYVSDSRSSDVELSSGLADGDSKASWYGIIATINPNTGAITILHTGTGEQCAWSIR